MPIASKKPHPEVPSPPAAKLARSPAPTPAAAGRRLWIRGRSDIGLWVADTAHADGLWALRGFGRSRPPRSIGPPASPDCRSPGSATQWARACDDQGGPSRGAGPAEQDGAPPRPRLREAAAPLRAETPPNSVAGKFSSVQRIDKKQTEKVSAARWEAPTTLDGPCGFRSGRNIGFPGRENYPRCKPLKRNKTEKSTSDCSGSLGISDGAP
jgi:hypothetical protein